MNVRWVLGWAAVWAVLTLALIAVWWETWANICDDCVPTGNPDDYGWSLSTIFWGPTLVVSGVVAAVVVVLAAVVVSRVLRARRSSAQMKAAS
jgi:hypothetical protein